MEESLGLQSHPKSLLQAIHGTFELNGSDASQYSPLALAFIGDGIYDLVIRTIIISRGNAPTNALHHKVSTLVNAAFQAKLIKSILPLLAEEEILVFKRGRNAKPAYTPKNSKISDYRTATGFEALMGYLYLMNRMDRALGLIKYGLMELRAIDKHHAEQDTSL